MKLTITQVANGFICDGINDSTGEPQQVVFEEKDNGLESMRDLLFWVKESFGVYYSKHNKENILIELKKTKK